VKSLQVLEKFSCLQNGAAAEAGSDIAASGIAKAMP
jgi:hypothetical protein